MGLVIQSNRIEHVSYNDFDKEARKGSATYAVIVVC